MDAAYLYHYHAEVTSVYDGDTCTVDIDLGLGVWVRGEKIRFYRINAPEVRGASKVAGKKSRDYLRGLIDKQSVILKTVKDKKGKYGRYLADVWVADEAGKLYCVNDKLVQEGFAVYKDY